MLIDWAIYGFLTWCLAALLNAALFRQRPASRATAWGLTVVVFFIDLAVMTTVQYLRYEEISDNLGFKVKPYSPLDTIGAFTFAWLFFSLLRKRPSGKRTQEATETAVSSSVLPTSQNDGVSRNVSAPVTQLHKPSLSEEDLWAIAADEVDGPTRRKGLWAKAFAEAQGNEAAAKVSYLKWRVEQLQNEEKTRRQQTDEAEQFAVTAGVQIIDGPVTDSHAVPTRDNAPDPALVEAVWKGNWNTASMLLAQGRKATGVDDEGRTLVDLAIVRKDKPMLELLRRYISSN